MSIKQPCDIFYDSAIPGLIDSNVSGTITQTTVYPQIFDYGDYILRMRIYDNAPVTRDLSSVDTFSLEIGKLLSILLLWKHLSKIWVSITTLAQ